MIWVIALGVAALIAVALGHKRAAVALGVVAGLLACWLLRARQRPAAPHVVARSYSQAKAVARAPRPVEVDIDGYSECNCDGDCDCD